MRLKIDVELDYYFPEAADVLLALEVAQLSDQILIEDLLTVDGSGPLRPIAGEDGIGQRTWLAAEGPFLTRYTATVDVSRPAVALDGLKPCRCSTLPPDVVPYLWPSRYCEADKFEAFVERQFGDLKGGAMLAAMARWIERRDGLCRRIERQRDHRRRRLRLPPGRLPRLCPLARQLRPRRQHPGAAGLGLCLAARAARFPCRCRGWLDGGWQLIDPTGLAPVEGLARIAVGRDATDIAFMTIFGEAEMRSQSVQVTRLDE